MATEIRIDNTGDGLWYLYNKGNAWKDYVCENFDENVVITGNRDYTKIEEASWWNEAKVIIEDFDYNGTMDVNIGDMVEYYGYTKEQIKGIIKAYDECRYSDDMDFIVKVAMILHPDMEIETTTLRGYTQGEWNNCAYVKGSVDEMVLNQYYFGQLVDVTVNTDDEEYGDIITHDELWEMERNGLKESLRKRYELAVDEEIVVLRCDGYKQVMNWEEVC